MTHCREGRKVRGGEKEGRKGQYLVLGVLYQTLTPGNWNEGNNYTEIIQ